MLPAVMRPKADGADRAQRTRARAARIGAALALALAVALAVVASGCSPLVRYGDIEPAPGKQVLVEVRVRPVDRKPVPPAALSASSHAAFRDELLVPPAKVSSETVASEMAADVQSSASSADDAAVDLAELGTDARRVEAMYAARGYFRARTTKWRIVPGPNRTARLDLEVREGPPTIVKEIVFSGIAPSPTDEAMNARLRELERDLPELVLLAEGDVWEEDRYLRSLDLVQRAFRERGFIHATVTGDNWVSRERHEVAVWFAIEHGPLVRASGVVTVAGQHNIPMRRIRARVGIDEGDILESKLLRETEQRVSELGPFFAVQVRPKRSEGKLSVKVADETPPPPPADDPQSGPASGPVDGQAPASGPVDGQAPTGGQGPAKAAPAPEDDDGAEVEPAEVLPGEVDLDVQLQEAALWDVTVGPAVTTDGTKLELALPTTFTHRNLFNQVVALRASVKPAFVLPDFKTSESDWGLVAKLGLDVPSFFEEFLRFGIEASYERDVAQAAHNQQLGARVGFSRRVATGLVARLGYELSQVDYKANNGLENVAAELARDYVDFRYKDSAFLSWLSAGLVLDLRDGLYDARHGAYAALTLDYGDAWVGSQIRFARGSLDGRGYLTFDAIPWFTIALRAKVGAIWFPQEQGTPQTLRFMSGGPTSDRGFNTDTMGDYICAVKPGHDPLKALNDPECGASAVDRIYIGGNFVLEGNVELRFQPGAWGFVAFMDVGRLWSRYQDIDLAEVFVTVGPGVRLATPVGPLRVDVGLRLGEQRDRVIHFSLGQAF